MNATEQHTTSYADYKNMVNSINTALIDLEKICGEMKMEENRKDLEKIRTKLAEHRFAVGVMGEFKRGKSTVINSLLEKEIMPSDILPCSATMNRVTYDMHPHVVLRMRDGSTKDISVDRLASYVTKLTGENESRAAGVDEAIVYYPCRFCQNGVDIVDTPGLNDDERMNKISEEVIPKLDAVIMVVTPDNPFSMSEAEFVRSKLMTSDLSRLIFLVNKIDQVRRKADRPRVIESIRQRIETSVLEKTASVYGITSKEYQETSKKLGKIRIYPFSALDALDGKLEGDEELIRQSGTLEFEDALTRILTEERGALELTGPLNAISRTAADLAKATATRKSALALSAQEFAECQHNALEQIRVMRQEKQAEKERLQRSTADAKVKMEQTVIQFYPQLKQQLYNQVEACAAEINLDTLKDSAGQQAAAETLQKAVAGCMEQEMALISEKVQIQMQDIIGDEAEKIGAFISDTSQKLDQLHMEFGKPEKLMDGADIAGTVVETFIGSSFYGIGGIVAGWKAAGLKGAVTGGGISFLTSYGIMMLLGGTLTMPLAIIAALAGTMSGKFLTKMIFAKDAARKKLEELKKSINTGIDNLIQEMQSKRELENWASDVAQKRFDELIESMEAECERMLRDTEASMDAIKQDLTENEIHRKQMEEACDAVLIDVQKLCQTLEPVNSKVSEVLART